MQSRQGKQQIAEPVEMQGSNATNRWRQNNGRSVRNGAWNRHRRATTSQHRRNSIGFHDIQHKEHKEFTKNTKDFENFKSLSAPL
jgi:hypothetical protein